MSTEISIQERRLELIQWLSVVDDAAILDKVAQLRDTESEDWWKTASEDVRASVAKGKEDADSGKLNPHSSARAIYEKWL